MLLNVRLGIQRQCDVGGFMTDNVSSFEAKKRELERSRKDYHTTIERVHIVEPSSDGGIVLDIDIGDGRVSWPLSYEKVKELQHAIEEAIGSRKRGSKIVQVYYKSDIDGGPESA